VLSSIQTSVIEDRYVNGTLQKLFRTGTQLSIAFRQRPPRQQRVVHQPPPAVRAAAQSVGRAALAARLRLGLHVPRRARQTEKTADASVYTYEADLANFVQSVINAYWQVVGARENVAVRQEAKALADRTVEENEARVRVGLFAPVAVLEAQADAASRLDQLIQAENTLRVQRQQLAQLAHFRPNGTFVPRTLEPVEDVAPEDVEPDLDKRSRSRSRIVPELKASALSASSRGRSTSASRRMRSCPGSTCSAATA
jgi:outer membrane protein TolC